MSRTNSIFFILFGGIGLLSGLNAMGSNPETEAQEQGPQGVDSTGATTAPPTPTASLAPIVNVSPSPTAAMPAFVDLSPSAKPKPIKLADLDESDRAIRRAINLSGHLCARPTEVRSVGADLYGVHCITNRDGTGGSNYLVNSRTNEVNEI